MRPSRIFLVATVLCLALSSCGSSGDDPKAEGSPTASPTTASATPTPTPSPKKRADPCSLISRATANAAWNGKLRWKKPEADKKDCVYASEEGAVFGVREYPESFVELKATCSTLPVEFSTTSFTCNVSTGDGDYAAWAVIERDGRRWVLQYGIDKGGINDKYAQVFVGTFVVELEDLDPKVLLKVGA